MARCDRCQRSFRPARRTQRFCSAACRNHSRNLRREEQRYYARRQRESERVESARDGRGEVCPGCGAIVIWTRKSRRYCSDRCRQRACRQRALGMTPEELRARIDRIVARIGDDIDKAQRFAKARKRLGLPPI